MLFDRTIRPASAVALHLTGGDRETAILALMTAYRLAFKRLHRLEDPERFAHWLLRMIDDRAPFPLGLPADSEILASSERDRVRRTVGVQTEAARRMARPVAVLAAVGLVAALVLVGSATLPSVRIADDPLAEPSGGVIADDGTADPSPSEDDPTEDPASTSPTEVASEVPSEPGGRPSDGPDAAASDEPGGGSDDSAVDGATEVASDDGLAETR